MLDFGLRGRPVLVAAVERCVAELGGIEVCVDVVGEARWGRVLDLDERAWDESFELVLRRAFLLARAAGRRMVAQARGGSIVWIASVSGLSSAPQHGAYGAAKAGWSRSRGPSPSSWRRTAAA